MGEMYNKKIDQEGTEVHQQEAKRPLLAEQLVDGKACRQRGFETDLDLQAPLNILEHTQTPNT